MTRLTSFTLTVLTALTVSCGDGFTSTESGSAMALERLRAEPYSFTYFSGLTKSERIVVRDENAWRETWSAMWQGWTDPPALPAVDFEHEVLIVVALGSRSNTGYGILADSAFQSAAGLLVQVRTVSPGRGCITGGAFTQPVDIARIPRISGEVTFRDRPEVTDCR